MTEEEKKAIERINNVLFDNDKSSLYIEIFKEDVRILLNLIQKQESEINKLNNVIDRMATWINDHEDPFEDCHETNISCADKECEDCIKEYFMKEDK